MKAETGGKGGGLHSRIHVWLYNEAIWWHKSVVSEVFEQALIFSSYICKVPENILMTFNHKRLFVCALPIVIPRVGFLSFAVFSAYLVVWAAGRGDGRSLRRHECTVCHLDGRKGRSCL